MTPVGEYQAPAPAPERPVPVLPVALLVIAVALAFADSSVVVLALPEIYGTFGVSIVDVSWVIVAYNVAVVVAAVALLAARPSARTLTAVGLVVFAASSLVCGVAQSFSVLVAGRVVQGLGGAALLVGSLLLLADLTGSTRRARNLWAAAAAVGVAIGPGLGGVLTELLSWRSIFLVQAPVAAVALVATFRREPKGDGVKPAGGAGVDVRAVAADAGFVLLFAALVGALFLSVLLFVVVWDYGPLQGALVVSALAVGTVAVAPIAQALAPWSAALTGGWLLTGGLLGLAWLPASSAAYAGPALAFCGCGFGLLNGVLGRAAFLSGGRLGRPAALEVGAKHAGIVLGLLIVAPMLAADLDVATSDATLAATAVVLDAPLELRIKVPLALDLRDLVEDTPRGEVPDVRQPFDDRGAGSHEDVARVRDNLAGTIEAIITRAFRPAFLVTALFAAVATLVALAAAARPRPEAA